MKLKKLLEKYLRKLTKLEKVNGKGLHKVTEDQDMHDVAEILATHMLSENTATKESDEDELAGFDMNV